MAAASGGSNGSSSMNKARYAGRLLAQGSSASPSNNRTIELSSYRAIELSNQRPTANGQRQTANGQRQTASGRGGIIDCYSPNGSASRPQLLRHRPHRP